VTPSSRRVKLAQPGQRPATPAIGGRGWLPRHTRIIRVIVVLAAVIVLLGAKILLASVSGRTTSSPRHPGLAIVSPGLLSGSKPSDVDLHSMAERWNVRAVANVGQPSIEERAVTAGLQQGYLESPLAARQAPTWPQLENLGRFLQLQRGGGIAYIHDDGEAGGGRAVVTAQMLLLLSGTSLPEVLRKMTAEDYRSLSNEQLIRVRDLATALEYPDGAPRDSSNVFSEAHRIEW